MLNSLLSLSNVKQLIQGAYLNPAAAVCIDSRAVQVGDVFVGLRGEQVDGNDYWQAAVDKGAALLVLERVPESMNDVAMEALQNAKVGVVLVSSGEQVLADWARKYRMTVLEETEIEIIGITGSNGKTSTKGLLKSVLSEKFIVSATAGNYNNHLGVPLTILSCDPASNVLIVELGTNHPGEIQFLCDIAQVHRGVITSIGNAHIEHLGSVSGVAKEKGALLRSLKPAKFEEVKKYGFAHNQVRARDILEQGVHAAMLWVGENHRLRLERVQQSVRGTEFDLIILGKPQKNVDFAMGLSQVSQSQIQHVRMPVLPTVMLDNIRLVVEVAYEIGLSLEQMVAGLESFKLTSGRFEIVQAHNKYWINDAYNANPDSLREAYASLKLLQEKQSDLWLVFANMGELGVEAQQMHYDLGLEAAQLGFNIIAVGEDELVRAYYQGAQSAELYQMEHAHISLVSTQEQAQEILLAELKTDDKVLFKASRAAKLDQLFIQLTTQ